MRNARRIQSVCLSVSVCLSFMIPDFEFQPGVCSIEVLGFCCSRTNLNKYGQEPWNCHVAWLPGCHWKRQARSLTLAPASQLQETGAASTFSFQGLASKMIGQWHQKTSDLPVPRRPPALESLTRMTGLGNEIIADGHRDSRIGTRIQVKLNSDKTHVSCHVMSCHDAVQS